MMRHPFVAAALLVLAALPATTTARDARADGAMFATRTLASLGADAARHAYALQTDATIAARRSYAQLAGLPTPESKVRTYDVKPVIDAVSNKKLQLATSLELTFITGKSLMVADLGHGTQLALSPTSFKSGAFTFALAF